MSKQPFNSSALYRVLAPTFLAVLYAIAIMDLDYGYYTFLRITSLVLLGIFIYVHFLDSGFLNYPCIAALIIAILYNPIFPIHMERDTWTAFNVISCIVMISIAVVVFEKYDGNQPISNIFSTSQSTSTSSSPNAANLNNKPPLSASDRQMLRDFATLQMQMYLERINDAYDLGLYDGDIYEISRSSSPFSELEKYVVPGPPSMEELFDSLTKTMYKMSRGIGLDDDVASDLREFAHDCARELVDHNDAHDIIHLYSLKEDDCTPETQYLVGKVDYIAITLVCFDHYADTYQNEYIKNKVQEIHQKRNAIFK